MKNKKNEDKQNQSSSIDTIIKRLKEQEDKDFVLEIPLGDNNEE